MSKKGVVELPTELIFLIISVIVIVLLFGVIVKLYGFFTVQEKDQAYGMLTNVKNNLESISSSESAEIYIYSPQDLYFMTFSGNKGPQGVTFPSKCLNQNCICICDEKCSSKVYCTIIAKPLVTNNANIKVKIPSTLLVSDTASRYLILNMVEEGKGKSEVVETRETTFLYPPVISKYSLISKKRSDLSKVDKIILHHTGGSTFQSAYDTLVARGLSVHYILDRDGIIYYLVDEKRVAYHAAGMNDVSIGIEIVNTGSKSMIYTPEQYASLNKLLPSIRSRWPNIKYDDQHIIGHYQTQNGIEIGKWDPSPNFDWAKINLPSHVPVSLVKVPGEAGYA